MGGENKSTVDETIFEDPNEEKRETLIQKLKRNKKRYENTLEEAQRR